MPDAMRIRDALERAAQQALRAGNIIKRLREFVAKGETQHSVESPVTLLEEAVALALLGAKEQGVRVAIRSDRDIPSIIVDKIQIQQVVLNLVRNAIEAMASSPRRELTVGVTKTDGVATFIVADTGPGIPPAVQAQLFETFRDRAGAETPVFSSAGLGLAICRQIVEHFGGRIWAEDAALGGAAICFTMPAAAAGPGLRSSAPKRSRIGRFSGRSSRRTASSAA